jgi:hypothetical protein
MGWQLHCIVRVKTPFFGCPKPLRPELSSDYAYWFGAAVRGTQTKKLKPAFPRPVGLVAAKAGFQIVHSAPLRFAFGMTKVKTKQEPL